jgi:hypothetical protein
MTKTFAALLIVSLFPLIPLFTPGLPVTHDGQDHVARIANFYQSLSEGNIIPRWGNNLNWGFGHPVLMFLYPLPSYMASIFHAMGFSFVDSVKLVFGFAYTFSILAMYLFAKDEWGKHSGILAAILYGFSPYRFVNLYVRGAIGEHVSFVFLPLILWGMSGLAKKRHKIPWGILLSFSFAGLFLSHNAVSIMIIPIVFFYAAYLIMRIQQKRKFVLSLLLFGLYGIGLAGFFLFPAFFEGKYTLRDIVTQGEIGQRMVAPVLFLFSPWNYGGGNEFTKEVGIPVIIVLVIALVKKSVFSLGLCILFLLYIFLMTSSSLFIWEHISLLQKFQFPWRLLVCTTFLGAITGAVVVNDIGKKHRVFLVFALSALSIFATSHMWKPKSHKTYDESFFTGIYKSTTDTGESSPIWSVRFMEFEPEVPMEVSEGKAVITPLEETTTTRTYMVNADTKSRLVENTLYFPGWNVFVNNKIVPVEFQDPQWRGRMTFWVEPGEHMIRIVFGETKLRAVSNIISLISVLGLVPILYFIKK